MKTGRPLKMERESKVVDETLAKESVAAHQATCGCHRESECSDPSICEQRFARQGENLPKGWHLDPLCKVRPEAKA